ncbi:MAG: (Fe-S)-binding protein [Ignavibacteria bacterium]|nr:(Fe-S)-binding protein [Ignavibacteria bacterium]MBI3766032.1 (Fe-S)-binding protein [Ignavibacteriales bacterium]
MHVDLFIPCYIDQFYPRVGIATLQLLEKLGCVVSFPLGQTCCGQPLANAGYAYLTKECDKIFMRNFSRAEYIVAPSGSCVLHVKEHLKADGNDEAVQHIRYHLYELTEFLTDVLHVEKLNAQFPHKVGLHIGCHGQRGLHLCSMSETMEPFFSKPEKLLQMVKHLKLSKPERSDECCGFGGTFSVTEEAVSVKMGKDTLQRHLQNNVEYITSVDMSCLMHLEGILKRQRSTVQVIHIAEILNAY